MIKKHVLSGVLAFLICFAIFAAVVFPLQQTSQISSPFSTIAATGPNNTDGWWIDDGRRGDSFAGGTGTEDDPYLIETAEQLAYLSYLIYSGTTDSQYSQYISGSYYFTGAYFKQTANIDLSDYYWQPIGNSTRSFSGNYDGSGYTVSGVYTPAGTGNAYSYQGLFGYVYGLTTLPPAIIEGVVLTTSLIQGYKYVAGIVGFGCWVIISNCSSSADVVGIIGSAGIVGSLSSYGNMVIHCSNHGTISGANYVGGVVGSLSVTSFPSDIFIANSYNEGDISGSSYVGGIAGDSQGSIFECYNIANISGESNVGGVAGRFSHASVDVCYNAGSITGSSTNVGGIIGYYTNDNSASSKVSNCFNVGAVLGSATNIGGIIGQAYYYSADDVYSCYFGGDCDNIDGIGYSRGTGDTQYSENLLDLVTTENWFLDESNWAAYLYWDFTLTWTFQNDTNNNLPILIDKNEKNVWTNDLYIDTDWEGTGTANDPFLISSAEELAGLSYNVYYRREAYSRGSALSYSNYYFKQTANINLSTYIWQPIGYSESSFAGNYDGNGFSITGLHTSISKNYSGLFGSVEGESSSIAVINNVSVINSSVSGTIYVGGIAGYISSNAKISKGYFDGEINGKRYVGGIVGISTDSLAIDNSYNKGTVFGTNYVGGISGGGSVIQSYNLGSIVGTGYVGGITGSGSPIRYSYNLGSINGHETYIGGIAGYGSTVDNCYYGGNCESTIGAVNGEDTAGASYSATLATDAKDANWYRSSMPWDLNNVWQLDAGQNDGYPTLRMTSTSTAYWTDDGVRGTSFAGGTGTEDDPFQIETAKQLAYLSYLVYSGSAPASGTYYYSGYYFVQTADIDLSGYYWQPIGIRYDRNGTSTNRYFSGHYDGGGHTVSGITTPIGTGYAYWYQGLFGAIAGSNSSNRAEITNIGVVDSFIQGAGYVGGIVGYINSSYGSVTNSYSSATINSIGSYAGGIVGGASNYTSVANNCYNTGSVFGAGDYVGGITGQGSVTNSYNLGTVSGAEYVGGITAYGSTVRNNFNLGSVSGTGNYLGGIAGQGSTVANNYYGGACENIGGVNGADTAGSAEFSETLADDARTQNWLTSTMGWDMYFVWKLDPEQNDGYPVFITDPAEANWWLASEDNYDLKWEGDGSRTNPYQISSAKELAGLSYRLYSGTGEHTRNYYYPNKYFVLTTNIDLSAHAWEPIGNATAYFSGIFDGAGYEISGVMGSPSYTYFALFSHVVGYGNRAEIKNLTVTDSVINAGSGAAGLLVLGENILISNCTSDVTLNASSAGGILTYGMASGIALSVYNGVIENCENMSTLNGSGSVAYGAGIASFASNVQITGCTNRASFSGMYNGGITVGPVSMSSVSGNSDLALNPSESGYSLPATITDCTNYGTLSGMGSAGIAMSAGEVLRCVNYGNIEGSSIAGIVVMNVNVFTSSFFSTNNIQYCVNYGTLTGAQLGGIAYELALQNGTFANCTNYGEIVATSSDVGGLVYQVGAATNTTLSNLANYGVISGSVQRIGGLIARISGSSNITITLEDCVNANAISITGQGNSAGGLVGETNNSGWTLSFENCVNTGNITAANSTIGGIIGSVTVPVTMTSVFSLCDIAITSTNGSDIGGLIGSSTATNITITSSVFEGDITSQSTSTSQYYGGFIGQATNCSDLSITGSYINTDITVASADAYASGMIGSITMSDTSSPAAIDKCAVVANISTSAEGEMTNSREFYFSPNLVDSATILNSYALFNNSLTISDTTTGMDGYFAYLDNFQNGLPIPIGLYYITAYGTTTGIADQLQKFVG